MASLDATGEDSAPLIEQLVDADAVAPWRALIRDELNAEVARLLDELPERERAVVARRHAGEPHTFAGIGRHLRISPERARRLKRRALARLVGDAGLRSPAAAA